MNTASKLRVCNKTLECVLVMILVSGIQLEATSGRYAWSVWAHVGLGIVLTLLSLYHIYMHYKSGNWFARFAKNRNKVTRILWWIFLLAAVSGFAATFIWLDGNNHSHLGAVHGKIGFLMVIFGTIHAVRHIHKHK